MPQRYLEYPNIDDDIERAVNRTPLVPLKDTCSRFYKLVQTNAYRMEYVMTISSKLFWFLGVLLGLVTFVGGIFLYLHQVEFNYCSDEIFLILIGFFVIVGSVLVYTRRSTPIVFDRQIGIYKKSGRSLGTKANYQHGIQESIALDRIHAIQLVSKIIVGEDDFPSYNCHEVNLVLKDGSRLGVVEHRKLSQSKEDARKLSTFLGVDVWANVIQEE